MWTWKRLTATYDVCSLNFSHTRSCTLQIAQLLLYIWGLFSPLSLGVSSLLGNKTPSSHANICKAGKRRMWQTINIHHS